MTNREPNHIDRMLKKKKHIQVILDTLNDPGLERQIDEEFGVPFQDWALERLCDELFQFYTLELKGGKWQLINNETPEQFLSRMGLENLFKNK